MEKISEHSSNDMNREGPDTFINIQDGRETIIIGMHFSKKGRTTLEDRAKKLIRADIKASNF